MEISPPPNRAGGRRLQPYRGPIEEFEVPHSCLLALHQLRPARFLEFEITPRYRGLGKTASLRQKRPARKPTEVGFSKVKARAQNEVAVPIRGLLPYLTSRYL